MADTGQDGHERLVGGGADATERAAEAAQSHARQEADGAGQRADQAAEQQAGKGGRAAAAVELFHTDFAVGVFGKHGGAVHADAAVAVQLRQAVQQLGGLGFLVEYGYDDFVHGNSPKGWETPATRQADRL